MEGGVYDAQRIEALMSEIIEKMDRFGTISLYLEDQNVEKFTLGAIFKEVLFKIDNKERLKKIALVSDRKWIHTCATLENQFLPIVVKSFEVDNRVEAMDWIMEH